MLHVAMLSNKKEPQLTSCAAPSLLTSACRACTDYCGIDQDDRNKKVAGVESLRGYVSVCNALLIPSPHKPEEGAFTVDRVPGGYGDRAWTRLESLVWFFMSTLKQEDTPELWVAAEVDATYLERFEFLLDPNKVLRAPTVAFFVIIGLCSDTESP